MKLLHLGGLLLLVLAALAVNFTQKISYRAPTQDRLAELYQDESRGCGTHHRKTASCRKSNSQHRPLDDRIDTADGATYLVNISIGSRGERLEVLLDTGSTNFWVTSSDCTDSSCSVAPETNKTRRMFDYRRSSSFQTDRTPFSADYANHNVSGFLGRDTIFVGPLLVTQADIGMTTKMSNMRDSILDGILGMTYPRVNPVEPLGVLERLKEQIGLFTIYYRFANSSVDDAGAISWGSLDPQNCADDFDYSNLTYVDNSTMNEGNYWLIEMQSFTYPSQSQSRRRNEGDWTRVALDSGAEIIRGPQFCIEDYATANGSSWNSTKGFFPIDCQAHLKTITFTIQGKEYAVTGEKLKKKIRTGDYKGECFIAMDFQPGSLREPDWLLGIGFFQDRCIVFDMGGQRVGIASAKA